MDFMAEKPQKFHKISCISIYAFWWCELLPPNFNPRPSTLLYPACRCELFPPELLPPIISSYLTAGANFYPWFCLWFAVLFDGGKSSQLYYEVRTFTPPLSPNNRMMIMDSDVVSKDDIDSPI